MFDWWHTWHSAIYWGRALIVLEMELNSLPGHAGTPVTLEMPHKSPWRPTGTKAGLLFSVCWHFFLRGKKDKSSFSRNALGLRKPKMPGQSWKSSPGCFAWGKQDRTGKISTGDIPKEWLEMIKKLKRTGFFTFFQAKKSYNRSVWTLADVPASGAPWGGWSTAHPTSTSHFTSREQELMIPEHPFSFSFPSRQCSQVS